MHAGAARRAPWSRWLLWLGFWTLLGLVFATQLYLVGRRLADQPYGWTKSVRSNLPDWYIWGLFALVVARLKQRVPIDRISWGYHFGFHVAASLLLALAHLGLAVPLQWVLRSLAGESYPIAARFVDTFAVAYLWNVVVYWAILAGVHGRDYYRDLQEHRLRAARLETQLARARFQALTQQLQPHFLFNTLNAIAELVHEDPDAADRMLGRLSELLRWTLDTADTQEIPLDREIELVGRYLEIERLRFADRLEVRLDIEPAARHALVPTMILLPLVENAIRHGIGGRTGGGGEGRGRRAGQVGVRAQREHGTLRLEIWDRDTGGGAGGRQDGDRERGVPRPGIGLSNTRARLEQLYGAAHRFELEQGGRGSVVRLALPFRERATA